MITRECLFVCLLGFRDASTAMPFFRPVKGDRNWKDSTEEADFTAVSLTRNVIKRWSITNWRAGLLSGGVWAPMASSAAKGMRIALSGAGVFAE